MKTFLNKALYNGSIMLFCLFGYVAHAEDCFDKDGNPIMCPPIDPPPPEVAPIDANIIILVFIAVLFGIYIIHNNKLNKKRPI